MSNGQAVELVSREIEPHEIHQSRVALTGAAQTVALGAAYRNIRLWLDAGSSNASIRINPDGTTTAADANDPTIADTDTYNRSLQRGISILYFFSAGSTGTLNVEAW